MSADLAVLKIRVDATEADGAGRSLEALGAKGAAAEAGLGRAAEATTELAGAAGLSVGALVGAAGAIGVVSLASKFFSDQLDAAIHFQERHLAVIKEWTGELTSAGNAANKYAKDIGELNTWLNTNASSLQEVQNKQRDLAKLRENALALGPAYRKAISDEADSYEGLIKALKKVNELELIRVNSELAKLEKQSAKAKPGAFSMGVDAALAAAGIKSSPMTTAAWEKQLEIEEQISNAHKARAALLPGEVALVKTKEDHLKALKGIVSEEEKLIERYTMEGRVVGLSKDILDRYTAQKAGATQGTLDLIVAVQAEQAAHRANIAAMEQARKSREQMYAEAIKYAEMVPEQVPMSLAERRLREDAQMLGLDTETPEERTARGLKHLQDMLHTGAIPSLEAYRRRWIELQRSAGGSLENIALVMQTVTDRMGQAFANFVTTGKMQFKDLVSSILAELARLYAQKAFAQMLEIGLGAFFSAGGNSLGGTGAGSQTGGGTGPFNGDGSGASGGMGYGLAPGSTQEAPQISTTITVHVQEGTAKSETQTSGKGGVDLGRLIDAKVRGVLMDEMRPNGLLNPGRA